MSAADAFAELYPAIYMRLHARRSRDARRLTPQMVAVLHHLALSGPLTVGEMSVHFDRAQSVTSEIVDSLEKRGLLARMRDARDRPARWCGSPTKPTSRWPMIAASSTASASPAPSTP